MPEKKNSKPIAKKSTRKTTVSNKKKLAKKNTITKKSWLHNRKRDFQNLNQQRQRFLRRRPHRSFRMTRRRDYTRTLKISGYWALTAEVIRLLWRHKKTFLALVLLFVVLTLLFSNAMSQDTYQQLQDLMNTAEDNGFSGVTTTIGLFSGVAMSYLTGAATTDTSRQVIGTLLGLFAWLTTIWLVRAISAGQKPKMRDGLYSSGSPVIALLMLLFVMIIQAVPAAVALIVYGALDASGMLQQTPILMLAGGATALIATMSLYWIVSTFFAMVVVTLPGVYPFRALRLSGDIVTGRRIRVLLRFAWAVVVAALIWFVVLIPVILLDGALKDALPELSWLPIVPVAGLVLVYFSVVFFATYSYLFYRKVVESDSQPAKN